MTNLSKCIRKVISFKSKVLMKIMKFLQSNFQMTKLCLLLECFKVISSYIPRKPLKWLKILEGYIINGLIQSPSPTMTLTWQLDLMIKLSKSFRFPNSKWNTHSINILILFGLFTSIPNSKTFLFLDHWTKPSKFGTSRRNNSWSRLKVIVLKSNVSNSITTDLRFTVVQKITPSNDSVSKPNNLSKVIFKVVDQVEKKVKHNERVTICSYCE